MNLDDFSYEENGRRYINPQVALDEENAFIQNLRDTQGQRNAQIAQQTNGLGKNVPTNLGSLNGSEAYFNARYQTPQTNSLIGDLRATAQATALNTALNNELTKANKRYKDAYYAAKDRERNATGTGEKALTNNELKKELGITSPGAKQETIYQNDAGKDNPNQPNTYTDGNGKVWSKSNLNAGERLTLPWMNGLTPDPASGTIKEHNGSYYLFLKDDSTGNVPTWFKVTPAGD